jgi:hypothetical protein
VQRRIGDWHDWQQLAEIARAILDPEQGPCSVEPDRRYRPKENSSQALCRRPMPCAGKHLAMRHLRMARESWQAALPLR